MSLDPVSLTLPRYVVIDHDKRGRPWKKLRVFKEVWTLQEVEGHPAVNPEYVTAPFEMTVRFVGNVYTAVVSKRMNAKLRILGKVKL